MSYVINKTNGSILATLENGTTNRDTGLTLIGRDYPNYGAIQNENFVYLLENFASDIPPGQSVGFTPIAGTLWWDTGTQKLKIYNGTNFITVSPLVESATAPTANAIGDQWWDTTNDQLSSWTGSAWQLIGPIYNRSQGKSGPFIESLLDNTSVPRTVVTEYVNGTVISISSKDTFILLTTTYGFSAIQQGINLPGNKVVEGNAYVGGYSTLGDDVIINGQLILSWLNGTTPQPGAAMIPGTNNIYDIGSTAQQFRNIYTSGNLVLTNANLFVSGGALVAQNKNYGGNVDIYVNATTGGNVKAISLSGTDGLAYVSSNPTHALGIATKNYTDTAIAAVNILSTDAIALINANVSALQTQINNDVLGLLSIIQSDVDAINAVDSATNYTLTQLGATVTTNKGLSDAQFVTVNSGITTINGILPGLAPLVDPVFGGNPRLTATPAAPDNSTTIATTEFVTRAGTTLAADYNAKISGLTNSTSANLSVGLAGKANINDAALTGNPTAPTATSGDNSRTIATTAFVTAAIGAQKFNYTVSVNPPSGGNNGDFWFQVG